MERIIIPSKRIIIRVLIIEYTPSVPIYKHNFIRGKRCLYTGTERVYSKKKLSYKNLVKSNI